MEEIANPECDAIVSFLRGCLPFNELPEPELLALAKAIHIVYHVQGDKLKPTRDHHAIYILRSGAVELRTGSKLLDRLAEPEHFNLNALAEDEPAIEAVVIDDTLLYYFDNSVLQALREEYRQIDRFFQGQRARRLRRAARYTEARPELLVPISEVINHGVYATDSAATVVEAAAFMNEANVSCLLVIDDGQLTGIVTDRDLRSRVLAKGLSAETLVSEIKTAKPILLNHNSTVFDAMLLMSDANVHHLPVVNDAGEAVSVVTTTDMVRSRKRDPVYFTQSISRKASVEEIADVTAELPRLVLALIAEGAKAGQISRFLCSVSDHVTRRLINLFIEQHGPAPVPFAWLSFGSQARKELALGGDQDNALVIDNSIAEEDWFYFEGMAKAVCKGLNQCGYQYCPGNIMASNPKYRMTLQNWQHTVRGWVRAPTDDAVMRVSIFYDIRSLHESDNNLGAQLQQTMLESASGNTIFLAALARNALSNKAPLGFFKRFVLEKNGEHKAQLDLKHRGVIPVVDLARIYAIANRITAVNTHERLDALMRCKDLSLKDVRNMQDALSFVAQIRLEQQCKQLAAKEQVSNYIDPKTLGHMAKRQLRDAFSIIDDGQEAIQQRFIGANF